MPLGRIDKGPFLTFPKPVVYILYLKPWSRVLLVSNDVVVDTVFSMDVTGYFLSGVIYLDTVRIL